MPVDITKQYAGFVTTLVNPQMTKLRPGMTIDRDDLVSGAYIGLVKALRRYNGQKSRFLTYATHTMRGEIKHVFRDTNPTPDWINEVIGKVNKAERAIENKTGRSATPDEVMAGAGIDREAYDNAGLAFRFCQPVSLDTRETEDGVPLSSKLADPSPSPPDIVLKWAEADALWAEVDNLPSLQATVIRMHFQEDLSKTEIGRQLGLSNTYVGYLVGKGIARLRRTLPPS